MPEFPTGLRVYFRFFAPDGSMACSNHDYPCRVKAYSTHFDVYEGDAFRARYFHEAVSCIFAVQYVAPPISPAS